MKGLIVLFALAILVSLPAFAGNPYETVDQARQRHSVENYDTYKKNGNRAPLGGYKESLGDPAPYGTERPGYTSPKGYGVDSPYGIKNDSRRY